jgi:hypothetical protein
MDIYVPPGEIIMKDWNILVIEYEHVLTEKFLGYSMNEQHYRLSSVIREYDPETNTGITESGSRYTFLTPPGKLHRRAQTIYDNFCKVKEVSIKLKYEF